MDLEHFIPCDETNAAHAEQNIHFVRNLILALVMMDGDGEGKKSPETFSLPKAMVGGARAN